VKKKLLINSTIVVMTTSIILTGFPLNVLVQNITGENVLETAVLAEEISGDIPELPSDAELLKLAEQKIAESSPEEMKVQKEAIEVFSDYSSEEFDVQEMTTEQEKVLTELIVVEAEKIDLPTEEDKESYVQEMLDFYDSNSENYQDLEKTTEELVEEIDENHSSILDPINGEDVLAASHGLVSVALLGSVVNTTINLLLISVGVGSVWVFIKKKGVSYVRNYFQSRIKARLATLVGTAIGVYYTYAWDFIMTVADPGLRFAKFVDSRDKIKNNKWIELR